MPATLTYNAALMTAVAAAVAVGEDCKECSVWDAEGVGIPPAGGNLLWGFALSNDPSPLRLGDRLTAEDGDLVALKQSEATDETNRLSERKCKGIVSGGIWLQFHDGPRGGSATGNVMNVARVALPEAGFKIVRS